MRQTFLAMLICANLQAALTTGNTLNWDVRTTGSDTNGGAFLSTASGTDFSQQNSAQTAFTDLVVGATTSQLTSVSHPFDATAPGNIINITGGAGCTTGRFQVLSVAGVTAQMDTSVGTAASVCTGNLGGSLATLPTANTATAAGNVINIKAGTYTLTSAITTASVSIWIGFGTTHGDRGTKPLITTATNSVNLFTLSASGAYQFRNLSMSDTAGTRERAFVMNNGTYFNLNDATLDGFSRGVDYSGGNALSISNVEIKNSVSEAVTIGGSFLVASIEACWMHDNGGSAVNMTASNTTIIVSNSILSANANGIATSNNSTFAAVVDNSDIANNTTDGVNYGTGSAANVQGPGNSFTNNIIYGNGRYGINYAGGTTNGQGNLSGSTNAYGGNGTANLNNVSATPGDLSLSANPFTSSTNFALNSTAGGGVIVKGSGFPGAFPGGSTTGTINVGAVQGSGGGGGGGQVAFPR